MSYDEHLISMAGGDGDELADIEHRIRDCATYSFGMRNADKLAHEDAHHLLTLVRAQQQALTAVRDLADMRGRCGWRISADEVRAALVVKP